MSLLLETTLGDIVIDLDLEGSPELCKNVLKLAKVRYYTANLIYNVVANRFCQFGDPQGDGSGGACIYGLLEVLHGDSNDVRKSHHRFIKSNTGRILTPQECQEKGWVVATEMNGIADTIGSQLLITIASGPDQALDGYRNDTTDNPSLSIVSATSIISNITDTELLPTQSFRSVGRVVEDDNHVLDQIAAAYCDANGRPYADIRILRALIVHDPFEDPPGLQDLMKQRGVIVTPNNNNDNSNNDDADIRDEDLKIISSPDYERPLEELVEPRIQADEIEAVDQEEDVEKVRQQREVELQRQDQSRAVVLEMLGDLPSADIKAPENVLFVCKLNPVTEDEDLELIFSRFDEQVKAEIIRDPDTGASLQYAFCEFTTNEQAAEAYFKMNHALVDDRRIKVDFSQSVAKVWDRFRQRERRPAGNNGGKYSNQNMPRDPFREKHEPSFQQPQQKHNHESNSQHSRHPIQRASHRIIHDESSSSRKFHAKDDRRHYDERREILDRQYQHYHRQYHDTAESEGRRRQKREQDDSRNRNDRDIHQPSSKKDKLDGVVGKQRRIPRRRSHSPQSEGHDTIDRDEGNVESTSSHGSHYEDHHRRCGYDSDSSRKDRRRSQSRHGKKHKKFKKEHKKHHKKRRYQDDDSFSENDYDNRDARKPYHSKKHRKHHQPDEEKHHSKKPRRSESR